MPFWFHLLACTPNDATDKRAKNIKIEQVHNVFGRLREFRDNRCRQLVPVFALVPKGTFCIIYYFAWQSFCLLRYRITWDLHVVTLDRQILGFMKVETNNKWNQKAVNCQKCSIKTHFNTLQNFFKLKWPRKTNLILKIHSTVNED